MLSEAKKAMRITGDAYDGEIASLLDAGAHDLSIGGVVLPGTVSFSNDNGVITDNSTLTDALVMRAIITYAMANRYGEPNADRLNDSYQNQKCQLMHASDYTDFDGSDDDAES